MTDISQHDGVPGQRDKPAHSRPEGPQDAQDGPQDGPLGTKLAALDEAAAFGTETLRWTSEQGRTSEPGSVDRARPSIQRRVTPRWRSRYTRLVVLTDLLVVLASTAVTNLGGELVTSQRTPPAALFGLPAMVVLALTLSGAYQHRLLGQGMQEFRRILIAGLCLVALVSTAAYAAGADSVRLLVLGGLPLALAGVLFVHAAARLVLYRMRRQGRCLQRVVVIGLERSVAELVRNLHRHGRSGMDVVAACVSQTSAELIEGVPVLGTPNDAALVLHDSDADTVVLTAWSDVGQEELRRLAWDLEGSGAHLMVAPRIAEVAIPRTHIRTIAGQLLLDIEEPEFRGLRRVAKTALDYALTITALVMLSPVLAVVAVAVKVSSPGPVLFRQERVGRHGEPFRMTKFRSMYVDAEARLAKLEELNETGGPMFKMKDDPRVTRVGTVIRRYSLDELPQLFDVLRGAMSLVGPRPPLPKEVSQYEQDVRRRLLVTPGITGLWQVSGRSDLSWEESVRLDLSYVENWSLGLDLSIIARTVAAVAKGSGAY